MFSLYKLLRAPYRVLRFDISVENTILVHVIYGSEDLVHQKFDPIFWQVMSSSLYGLIHVHIHQLEYQCQSPCGLIAKFA